ncbi:MAG: 4Fe-4S dicluster domain-containing protein [Chloroflexi bacterium]|nr:4Fe-4S dicluster domain-containing protein [Chloroflexota bacterium]
MIAGVRGMLTTLRWLFKRPVTAHYPDQHLPVQERYMGFPALLWDETADEPFCTGCMVCIRECPTQCMSAQMMDNPKFTDGSSHRRKIIETFEINLNRCILCGICVDVCAFDAIEMSYEHELASYSRAGARADLETLLDGGRHYQVEASWVPLNADKNVAGVALAKKAAAAKPDAPDEARIADAAQTADGGAAAGTDGAEVDA